MLGTLEHARIGIAAIRRLVAKRAWEEHEAIADAISSGDTAMAMNEMAAHINNSRDYLIKTRAESTPPRRRRQVRPRPSQAVALLLTVNE